MTLEIEHIIRANTTNQHTQFSSEQLEILKEEYSRKLVNEELENLEVLNQYRKKLNVSKRDAFDIIARNIQDY